MHIQSNSEKALVVRAPMCEWLSQGPTEKIGKASRGFEPRSLDSESRVLTVTPRGQLPRHSTQNYSKTTHLNIGWHLNNNLPPTGLGYFYSTPLRLAPALHIAGQRTLQASLHEIIQPHKGSTNGCVAAPMKSERHASQRSLHDTAMGFHIVSARLGCCC